LEALLQAPELWGDTVAGWVALQAPFYGSPVADPAPSAINGVLLSAVGGNGQSLDDLKTTIRGSYMADHESQIADLTASIPGVISRSTTAAVNLIRSQVTNALSSAVATLGPMDLTNVYMNTIVGVPNDGLVPRDSTNLAGVIHRQLPLGDHASTVMDVDPMKNFWTVDQRNTVTSGLIDEVRGLAAGQTQ